MTPEKVIKLAKQAELPISMFRPETQLGDGLRTFAELVRNQTLEEAAKYCEGRFSDGAADIADGLREMKK